MGNVWRVFKRDLKRLATTPAAWSVAFFLIVLPSLYTWFNVAAFWNPYENTGNLRICVVNEDEGASDETLGDLHLGNQVVEQLQDNDQLDWVFVSREEAMHEVNAGTAYAAFVIPADFSRDVTTLLTDDIQQPKLEYYVNEKKGPVSPKITDTGANALDTTINDAFFSTVSSTVVAELNERWNESKQEVATKKSEALQKLDEARGNIAAAREALGQLTNAAEEARAKAATARATLADVSLRIDKLASDLKSAGALVGKANNELADVSGLVNSALDDAVGDLAQLSAQSTLALTETTAAIKQARAAIPRIPVSEDLENLDQALDNAVNAIANSSDPIDQKVSDTLKTAEEYRKSISANAVPSISTAIATISSTSAQLSAAVSGQKVLVEQTMLVLDELDSTLVVSEEAVNQTDRVLADLEADLETAATDLSALGMSSAMTELFGDDGIDPEKVAEFMMSPTQVQTEELYPINAYGSAMAPLFLNLTLWIGVFMLMVIMRLEVDDEDIPKLTIAQRFLGRGILLAIMCSLQAVVCCTGCLVLGVQTVNPVMFYLTAVIASLSYLAIQYTLSTTLQHVGKAMCIILVFVQIPGATGLYPIEMTPDFFHFVYPLFPFTYGINAIRETTCGFYGNTWAYNVGVLGGFFAAFVLAGALLRPYMTNLNRLFAREIEESDIVNGESVQLPARRYRMSQIISAFTDREEYRQALDARIARFIGLYPLLMRGALIAGIAVPVVSTTVLMLLGVEKVVVLTTWLVWFLLVVTYLIVVEYLRDYLTHLVSLESMSADDVRAMFAQRNHFTRVQPITRNLGRKRADGKADEDDADAGAGTDDNEDAGGDSAHGEKADEDEDAESESEGGQDA